MHPAGRNLAARCPWHNDRRPSLTVNRQRQTWKCWPCDIGGDVFSFVMRRDGIDFPAALRMLAEQAGIQIEEYRGRKAEAGSPEDKATLLSAMKLVADAYFQQLADPKTDDARVAAEYLQSRGIDDENRKRFQVGFAPDQWSFAVDLLKSQGISQKVAVAAGVASEKKSGRGAVDMFRGRLMFPICDLQGRPISMGGRVIPEIAERHGANAGGKYINGRETKLFHKSTELYGLQLAREAIRREGHALVMEGYTDVVAARQAGIEPVVAVLGTALGQSHVKLLNRFVERVVLVLDGDDAGQRRADEVLELFVQADIDLRVLTLPDGNDPADFIADNGSDALRSLVAEAPDALDFKLNRLTDGIDVTRDTHGVTTAIDAMMQVIAKASKMNTLKIDQMLLRMGRLFGISAQRLGDQLGSARARLNQQNRYRPRVTSPRDPNEAFAEAFESSVSAQLDAPAMAPEPLAGIDRELFETLIESPELAAIAVESINPEWLESMTAKMLLSAYQDLELAGRELDVDSLLILLENDFLKSQIVTLQNRVQDREGKLGSTPDQRYTAIFAHYQERESQAETTRRIAKLEAQELTVDEETALLQELFQQQRQRHGIKSK